MIIKVAFALTQVEIIVFYCPIYRIAHTFKLSIYTILHAVTALHLTGLLKVCFLSVLREPSQVVEFIQPPDGTPQAPCLTNGLLQRS